MAIELTLSLPEYESLVALARRGTEDDSDKARDLEAFLKRVETNNGITRHFLLVRWQELNEPLPAGTRWPETWPPELQASIEQTTRAIAEADVDLLIQQRAKNPLSVMVTTDPAGIAGWTLKEDYFL